MELHHSKSEMQRRWVHNANHVGSGSAEAVGPSVRPGTNELWFAIDLAGLLSGLRSMYDNNKFVVARLGVVTYIRRKFPPS